MKKPLESKEIIISRLRLDPEVANWVKKDRGTNPKGNGNATGGPTD